MRKRKKIRRAVSFVERRRWRYRPEYKGYIIPYTTLIDDKGVPNFQAIDQEKVLDCIMNQKCGVCGQSLRGEQWIAFIGGDKCAQNFAFVDPGMHPECAYYAAETCPYLKNEDGAYSKTPNLKAPENAHVAVLEEVDKQRPARMMILFTKGYEVVMQGLVMLIIAKRDPHIIDWEAMPPSVRHEA